MGWSDRIRMTRGIATIGRTGLTRLHTVPRLVSGWAAFCILRTRIPEKAKEYTLQYKGTRYYLLQRIKSTPTKHDRFDLEVFAVQHVRPSKTP